MTKTDSDDAKIAVMSATMTRMGLDLTEIKNNIKELMGTYSTKEELAAQVKILQGQIQFVDVKYQLSRTLIFGFCGLALLGIVGAMLSLIIRQ